MALRRVKEEAERKERQQIKQKAEASRAKKKADELKKKVMKPYCGLLLYVGLFFLDSPNSCAITVG